ncbi:MAG: hypothetical protein CR982_08715 [Candidatus Cloacimonadota bacterium]|nr:MAG: hypothetical protein CR982_08715 [Candidatus Cloacimonadota bacterium]PIE77716.1 MAG: hypothetical protein CSA15_11370 [Candidatus Delongbacteria bacterium]
MRELFRRVKNSDFFKNVMVLLTGTLAGQMIISLSNLLIPYIYNPEAVAVHQKFISIATVIVVIAAAKFDVAILLPKEDSNGKKLFRTSFYFIILTTILTTLALIFIPNSTIEKFDFTQIIEVKYLLPFWIFTYSVFYLLQHWHTRKNQFKIQSRAKISQGLTNSFVKIPVGIINPNGNNLIFGDIISYAYSIKKLLKGETFGFRSSISLVKEDILYSFKNFSNFFKFSLPMGLLNVISLNLISYVLTIQYSDDILGNYSQSWRVMNMPLNIVTIAFSSVFYKKIKDSSNREKIYIYSFIFNFLASTIILSPLLFFGEEIFLFVFPEKWRIAGEMSSYLVPLSVGSFAMGSVSSVFSLTQKNEVSLVWQIFYLLISLGVIFLTSGLGYKIFIITFSITGLILYLILFFYGIKVLGSYCEEGY